MFDQGYIKYYFVISINNIFSTWNLILRDADIYKKYLNSSSSLLYITIIICNNNGFNHSPVSPSIHSGLYTFYSFYSF